MELKDKLKKLRLDLGLTQSQLAEKLFVSRSTVENGKMGWDCQTRNL